MDRPRSKNLTWHEGRVPRSLRYERLGQKGATLWFTGLSGSGKSTVSAAVEERLVERGCVAYRLDGDNVRLGINADLGFSPEDRTENIRRVGEISRLFADAGVIVLSSFISPYCKDRSQVRQLHDAAGLVFVEIFVDCPLAVVEARDPKGLYKKARSGLLPGFTGISAPYEAPETPDVHLRSDRMSVEVEVDQCLRELERCGVIPSRT